MPHINNFNKRLEARLDCTNFEIAANTKYDYPLDIYDDMLHNDNEPMPEDDADNVDSNYNLMVSTFLLIPFSHPENDGSTACMVIWKTDIAGRAIGRAHTNLLLDT